MLKQVQHDNLGIQKVRRQCSGLPCKNLTKLIFFLFSFSLLLFLSGCSLPRVVIPKDPLTPEEHLNLGVAYESKGEFENAIKEYQLASRKVPAAYLYLGNAYLQKKQWDEAEKYYRKAIKKNPMSGDAHNNLAWLYYLKGERLDVAESLARKAIELNPSKEPIYRDTLEKIREKKNPTPAN